jgi:hypothetical protein
MVNEDGSIEGVQIGVNAPKINHLFFADDSLIVMKANTQSSQKLKEILALYEAQSEQMINKDKSSTFFSKGTRARTKRAVLNVMGIPRESENQRSMKVKIWRRIQGWKERLLSKAGKDILIKEVAHAIPTYAMPCFDLTKKLCNEISSMICCYWWNNQEGKRQVPLGRLRTDDESEG